MTSIYDLMENIDDPQFNRREWNISRAGRHWTSEEFDKRMYQTPEKIEFVGGIFTSDEERMVVLAMLLENLGIDRAVRFGKLEDWKAAVAALEAEQGNEHKRQ